MDSTQKKKCGRKSAKVMPVSLWVPRNHVVEVGKAVAQAPMREPWPQVWDIRKTTLTTCRKASIWAFPAAILGPGLSERRDVVLDLGSGGGFDVFQAGPRVGKSGRVIGVDMTAEIATRRGTPAYGIGNIPVLITSSFAWVKSNICRWPTTPWMWFCQIA